MKTLLLCNAAIMTAEGFRPATDVYVEGGVIARIGQHLPVRGGERFDVGGRLLAPGFIDLHIHGAAGAMCELGDPAAIRRISEFLPRFGVTGFLATVATLPPEQLRAAVDAVVAVAGQEEGARILGIHLEGPYLSPLRAGAQAVPWMRSPSIEEIDGLQARARGRIRMVTVAPELDGALPLIAALRDSGIVAAVGHSNATADEMLCAIGAGATHVTHLFNAMRELHHREPGVLGVALTEDAVSVEVICDGHHVAPRVVDLVLRSKPANKFVLVSDAVAALGMPDGEYEMFGVPCAIAGGAVRLREGGTLAGSCLSLDRAVRNLRRWLPHLSPQRAIEAASAAPAAVIGEGGAGRIAEGCVADLIVLEPDLAVAATFCRGRLMWQQLAPQVP